MANIQSGINQIISLASLLATQNPSIKNIAERRSELSRVKNTAENLESVMTSVKTDFEKNPPAPGSEEMKDFHETMTDYAKQGLELKKKAFELDPSQKTYAGYKALKNKMSELDTIQSQLADVRAKREQANARTMAMQEARRQTRASILEGTPSEYASEYQTWSSAPATSLLDEEEV